MTIEPDPKQALDRHLFERDYAALFPVTCTVRPEKFRFAYDGDYEEVIVMVAYRLWRAGRARGASASPSAT